MRLGERSLRESIRFGNEATFERARREGLARAAAYKRWKNAKSRQNPKRVKKRK
ncbi:MAG: hypothetical protein HY544_05410 [Candidatus Diapherotrites archaeon]|uniref:Uncharacterized protein n=1 Tax=Candidatus Iainarchaeum sp. TaxID=3101447 RepID=A0A8T3YS02_9ARCH|nr:hypothetical protein [Candidatus Diapherotrites archaeon]